MIDYEAKFNRLQMAVFALLRSDDPDPGSDEWCEVYEASGAGEEENFSKFVAAGYPKKETHPDFGNPLLNALADRIVKDPGKMFGGA